MRKSLVVLTLVVAAALMVSMVPTDSAAWGCGYGGWSGYGYGGYWGGYYPANYGWGGYGCGTGCYGWGGYYGRW
jgi:hypothetical protein